MEQAIEYIVKAIVIVLSFMMCFAVKEVTKWLNNNNYNVEYFKIMEWIKEAFDEVELTMPITFSERSSEMDEKNVIYLVEKQLEEYKISKKFNNEVESMIKKEYRRRVGNAA